MSWIGQIVLAAYVVVVLGTVAALLVTVLVSTTKLPSTGKGGASSRMLPGRKTTGTRRQ
jgi:hypothetical protein